MFWRKWFPQKTNIVNKDMEKRWLSCVLIKLYTGEESFNANAGIVIWHWFLVSVLRALK
jgi:hypothetical protein